MSWLPAPDWTAATPRPADAPPRGSLPAVAGASPLASRAFDAPTDEMLLLAHRSGDASAFRELVTRHAPGLLACMRRLVRDGSWAEDLTQDVFLKLARQAPLLEAGRTLRPWLYAVARNQGLDFLKRQKRDPQRRPAGHPRSDLDAVACARPTPPDRAARTELQEKLAATLEELPEEQRGAFELCVLDGLSYDDAAEALGCSVKTLSSRLARARERVRTTLAKEVRP